MSIPKYIPISQALNSKSFWSFGHWNLFVICILLFGIFGIKDASAATISKPMQSLGLVGYWSFDVGKGGAKAVDMSGRGNNGTLTNMNTTAAWVGGKIGNALNFDGVDDRIDIPDSTVFNGSAATWSAWIFPNVSDSNQRAWITKGTFSSDWSYALQWTPTFGNIRVFITNTAGEAGNNWADTSNAGITINTWYHIVVVYDGSLAAANRLKIYVNNKLSSQSIFGTIPTSLIDSAAPLRIGEFVGLGRLFSGKIDEVRIYNRALSPDEIKRLYRQTSPQFNASQANKLRQGLVGMWTFDGNDMSGNTAIDRSGNGNNGTLTNGPKKVIGKIGQGLNFDGVNDYVSASQTGLGTTAFTISAWIKASGAHSQQGIVGAWSNGGYKLMGPDSSGIVTVGYRKVGGTYSGANASGATLNVWHHVTTTFNGSTKIIIVYIDGVAGTPVVGSDESFVQTATALIGYNNDNTRYFNGFIDEVRVYNRALTEAEIKQLYKAGSSFHPNVTNKSTIRDGLVGHWSFDGADMGTTSARDASGNANTGWLINGTKKAIGKIGQALSFDGVNDYVDLGNPASLQIANTVTIAGWVYLISEPGTINPWFSNGYTGVGSIFLGTHTAYPTRWWGMLPGASEMIFGTKVFNQWTHLVVTLDLNLGSNQLKGYQNGVFIYQRDWTSDIMTASATRYIGRRSSGSSWDGLIDEVRVYNRALSEAEIKRLYNMGR